MMRWPICAGSPLTEMRPAIITLPFRAANQCLPQQAPCAVWAHRPPRLAHFSVTCPVSLCARRIVHTVCALAQLTISLKNALSETFAAGTGVCGARLFDDVPPHWTPKPGYRILVSSMHDGGQ